jgi:hypothetical protein
MAIKFLSAIDLGGLELINAKPQFVVGSNLINTGVPQQGELLASAHEGRIVYDSTSNAIKFSDGSTWLDVSGDIREIAVGDGLTGGGSSGTVTVSVASTIAGAGLTWASGVAAVGAGTGITVNADDVQLKNAGNLTQYKLLMWGVDQLEQPNITRTVDVSSNETITFGGAEVVISGNLTVNGTTTSVNSNEVNIGDSIIKLNSDATGSATADAGFEVERGDDTNVSFIWDESEGYFSTVNQKFHVGTVDTLTPDGDDFFYMYENAAGETGIIKKANVNTVADLLGAPKWFTLDSTQDSVSKNGNAYTITHDYNTQRIMVQVVDSTTFETVHVDTTRPSTSTVTISFANSVSEGDYIAILSAAKLNGDSLVYEGLSPSP